MASYRSHWLKIVPSPDPIERSLSARFEIMLYGLIVATLLGLPLMPSSAGEPLGRLLAILTDVVLLLGAASALIVFRRGHFKPAVLVVTTGFLIAQAIGCISFGLRTGALALSGFMLPIILAGFLAGRPGLFLTIVASLATVVSTAYLETFWPSIVGFAAAQGLPDDIRLAIFMLIVCLVGMFIDQFVLTLRGALNDALARERELERIQISLEARTVELSEAKERLERELVIRKQTEAALAYERDLLHALMDNTPDMIYFKDKDSRFIRINRAQAKLLRVSNPQAAVGKTDFDFQTPGLAQTSYAEEQQIVETGQPLIDRLEFNPDANGQSHWFSTTKVPIVDTCGHVTGIIGISRDITARQEIERLKNEFISTVSHELRTPLTSIRGSLGLLSGGMAGILPDKALAMIEIAYRNSERLMGLINDLLDIEKIETGKMAFALASVELSTLVKQVIEMNMAYAAQFEVTLAFPHAPPDIWVNVDGDRLIQVLTNLISNAAKFSPPGSTVEVAVSRSYGKVHVTVADHGPGIPKNFHDHVFDKFAQADSTDARQKGGTGLGLSIAKAIVERLGGEIGFTTEIGVGTVFYVDLPEYTRQPPPDGVE
jgi:PAS domain S-box-containing protein